jgi:ABC-type transporter Mla maintaining outer membrane lipid asymmetry permease subunit MlaE
MQAAADRAFLPVKGLLEQVGDMMVLTGKTLRSAIKPPYPYGMEFVQQFMFALKLCWFPLLISTVAINYGAPGTQAGVPRFLALMFVTGLFDVYAVLFGLFGGVLTTLAFGQPLAPFFATLLTNASTTDLWGSVVKCTMFGAIIAVVSCYKGMTASGGAEGVGRAVNQAVVISFLGIAAFNYVFTQTLLATHPEMSVIK